MTILARRYAQALYEISQENKSISLAIKDINTIKNILENVPLIRDYCFKKDKKPGDQIIFIETAFYPYVSSFTGRLLRVMVANNRISSLPFLPQAFEEISDIKENKIAIELEVSHHLSDVELENIKEKMEARIKKTIYIKPRIIPELLGGFRLIWQNRILDLSVKGKMNQIRREILEKI